MSNPIPSVSVRDLRVNARTSPVGFDEEVPEFSWAIDADGIAGQSAYEVQVVTDPAFQEVLWESGRVKDDRPFGVRWERAGLISRTRYFWRVRIWLDDGAASGWSEPSFFETGLLDQSEWKASWITGAPPADEKDQSAIYFNRKVDLPAAVVRGRAYVTSLGWYRLFVNGQDLTGPALVPRWTPWEEFVEYQVVDVTDVFAPGDNVIALAVGDGRYRGRLGTSSNGRHYGDRLAARAQIELDLADGSTVVVPTDTDWAAGPGRITSSDPKFGERVDLRIPDADWLAGERPARFRSAEILHTTRRLVAEQTAPFTEVGRRRGTIGRSPSGKQLVDFGQNLTGVVRIRLSGAPGTEVVLNHAEVVGPDGEIDELTFQSPAYPAWHQGDRVVLDGEDFWYQPWFTYRGFRHLEIDGLEATLTPDDVEAIVLSSELEPVGSFESSDPRVNQLYSNVVWSMRSNFIDVPTDCPTRERSGWTGDAQIFAPTATRIMDVRSYFARYLRIVAAEQREDGTIPGYVPSDNPRNSSTKGFSGWVEARTSASAGWGDAAVLIPWAMYEAYGDVGIIGQQWDSMVRWVERNRRAAAKGRGRGRLLRRSVGDHERFILGNGYSWGEWIRPHHNVLVDLVRLTVSPPAVVQTAYFEHSARLLGRMAAIVGRDADADNYTRLADDVRNAWRAAFVRDGGSRIGEDMQDDYVRALAFDLLTPPQRERAADRLVERIREDGDHLGTGFLSTGMLLPTLTEVGRSDVALDVLLQSTAPSWLSWVDRGATTIWESWEGFNKKGQATPSHNHYSFGAVASWLIDELAGLAPAAPAYRRLRIAPVVDGPFEHARAAVRTPFGPAASSWRRDGDRVELHVVVPRGCTAEVHLGTGEIREVGAGEYDLAWTHRAAAARPVA